MLDHFGVSDKYEKISNSEKIKWVYLRQNELGLESCGYKGYEDPPEIVRFMNKKMYSQMLEKKIMMFYESLSWDKPVNKKQSIERFF